MLRISFCTDRLFDHIRMYNPSIILIILCGLLLHLPSSSLVSSLSVNTCEGEWKFPAKCTGYGCDYKVSWEYLDDEDDIRFTVSTKNRNKWTGIGFSIDKNMPATDAILGLVEESGRFFLMDTWLRNYAAPILDQVQSIHNMSAWRENGITSLRFHRKRRTGDRNDFQFSDTKCPYFVFPVQGGVFNAINKRLRKHEATPIVSESRICVKSCNSRPPVSPVPPPPPAISSTTPNSRKPVQSSPNPTTTPRIASSPVTTSPTRVPSSSATTSSSISTRVSTSVSSSTSSSVPNIFGSNMPQDWDYSQFMNITDFSKLPQLPPGSPKLSVLANFSAILSKMNMSRDDFPSLLKSLAGKFPAGFMNESSPFLFPSPAQEPKSSLGTSLSSHDVSSTQKESHLSSTSAPPSLSSNSDVEKEPLPDPLDTDSHSINPQSPSSTPASYPSTTSKPVFRKVSARTRIPSRWSTYKPSTTSTTSTTTAKPDQSGSDATSDDEDEDSPDEESRGNDLGSDHAPSSTTSSTVSPSPEIQESNYVVELKLPKAWKSVYARKKSDEYKKFRDSVEDQVRKELQDKFSALEVRVMELKSGADGGHTGDTTDGTSSPTSTSSAEGVESSSVPSSENHSVIAKLKVKFAKDVTTPSNGGKGGAAGSSPSSSSPQTPVDLTETLNLAIKDGRVGDFSVDSSYLIVRPFESEGQIPSDSESREESLLTDEQLKWLVIIGGLAALVLLVIIQASCMVWRDKKNRTRNLHKDKPSLSGHNNWKDYSPPIANGPYTYENFGVTEDPDGNNLNSSAGPKHHLNGSPAGKSGYHHQHQNGTKQHSNSSQHHRMISNTNGKYSNDKLTGGTYNNGDTERSGMPLPPPPLRSTNQTGHHATGQNSNHHHQHHSSSHNHHHNPEGGGRNRGDHPRNTPSSSHTLSQLQPDFYFMPHQRRYSGEVVRVFVDYNNREQNNHSNNHQK